MDPQRCELKVTSFRNTSGITLPQTQEDSSFSISVQGPQGSEATEGGHGNGDQEAPGSLFLLLIR